jgi:choline dehydrogenase-like flavoprotein
MSEDILVVGSGVGGATIAKELTKKGKKVTILETGAYPKIGTETKALNYYTGGLWGPGEFTKEKVEILRTEMVGGSSIVTIGNGVRSLQKEFNSYGIDLEDSFIEAESELKITPCPEENMGERTKLLAKASEELGYNWKPMPKFIDFTKCKGCGNCGLGCIYGAKWTSRNYIGESYKNELQLKTNHKVEKVLHQDGQVQGVTVRTSDGVKEIKSDKVILSAGGIGTPVILQNSGIEAGSHLFADVFINTFGIIKDASFKSELDMAILIDDFHDSEGYILSPYLEGPIDLMTDRIPLMNKWRARRSEKLVGVMAKTKDLPNGQVHADGKISKPVTEVDRLKIEKGFERSKMLLEASGCDSKSIFRTHLRAAHPGGSAGVGRVVDKGLETEVSGLFVCDCSVFPETPGKPPVLTVVALAKYLGNLLV